MNSQNAPWVNSLIRISRELKQLLIESYGQNLADSESTISLLKALAAPSQLSATQSEIAARLGLSESTLCTLIEKLRCEGLIIRERLQTDRRKTKLGLTELGRDRVLIIERVEQQIEEKLVQSLVNSPDIEQFQNALPALLHAITASRSQLEEHRRAA